MRQIIINNVQTKGFTNKKYMYLPQLHIIANLLVSAELVLLEELFWRLYRVASYKK